ncbi:MAG: carboxypeptidase-like regulatory domain-containing protein, partial [Flavisolibacter sp.]
MMKVRCFFLWATLLWGISGFAQNKFTINGYIRDSVSGESLLAATVTIDGKAVTSNAYGFYSLTLEEGEYDVSVSHVSYAGASFRIQLRENQERNIFMVPRSAALNEVVVYSKKRDANIRNAQMGKVDLSIGQIKSIPAFLGEVDILKAIQLLPGVQTAGEGNSGFYVRGGGPDQNL